MNAKPSSALWILSLAGSFAIANPSTVHAPSRAPSLGQGAVPVTRYLDLGQLMREESSLGYTPFTALTQELSEDYFSTDAEHRYQDLGRERSALQTAKPSPSMVRPGDD